jgi:hypothetical protein
MIDDRRMLAENPGFSARAYCPRPEPVGENLAGEGLPNG